MTTRTGDRGFALPLVLAVLAVGSILGLGLFLVARLDRQSGDNGLSAAHAFEAAETGMGETFGWWDPAGFNRLAPGDSLLLAPVSRGRSGYRVSLRRLGAALFLVRSEGWHQPAADLPTARRELRALARLPAVAPAMRGGLVVLDSLEWDGVSGASGEDTIPAGWSGRCQPDSSVPGLVLSPGAAMIVPPCPSCAGGSPAIATDSGVTSAILTSPGSVPWDTLAAHAVHRLSGSAGPFQPALAGSPPDCDLADSLNWGEPLVSGGFALCGGFFPLVYSAGDLTIAGGRGQGILLVQGDLALGGGFWFAGLIIVQGALRKAPGGGLVTGQVIARSVRLDPSVSGSLSFQYSACVLPLSTRGSSLAAPLRSRGWAQAF